MSEKFKIEVDAEWRFERGSYEFYVADEMRGYYFKSLVKKGKFEVFSYRPKFASLGNPESEQDARRMIIESIGARIIKAVSP